MKIGILGNQNNNHFVLTRYLRSQGFNAYLCLLDNEDDFYHPQNDTYTSDYKEYTHHFNWGNYHRFLMTDKELVLKDLSQFDFLIGVGTAPAFVNYVGLKLDVLIPCGGDLSTFPFLSKLINTQRLLSVFQRVKKKKSGARIKANLPTSKAVRNPISLLNNYYQFTKHQRIGIENSGTILFDKTNPKYEKIHNKLREGKSRIIAAPPMIYTEIYTLKAFAESSEVQNHENYKKTVKIKENNDFLILQYCRQSWKNVPDWVAKKGNDKLVKGLKLFINQFPKVKTHLILYDFGADVDETKALAKNWELKKISPGSLLRAENMLCRLSPVQM